MPPEKTKLRLYLTMNPELDVHPLYKTTSDNDSIIEDNLRMAFTRVRLCSHRLRSETGRWNRVPSDQRFCPHCGGTSIQNEEHLFQCPATLSIHEKYGVQSDLLSAMTDPSKTDLICLKQCLKLLESINEPESDQWTFFFKKKRNLELCLDPSRYILPLYLLDYSIYVQLWIVNNN